MNREKRERRRVGEKAKSWQSHVSIKVTKLFTTHENDLCMIESYMELILFFFFKFPNHILSVWNCWNCLQTVIST